MMQLLHTIILNLAINIDFFDPRASIKRFDQWEPLNALWKKCYYRTIELQISGAIWYFWFDYMVDAFGTALCQAHFACSQGVEEKDTFTWLCECNIFMNVETCAHELQRFQVTEHKPIIVLDYWLFRYELIRLNSNILCSFVVVMHCHNVKSPWLAFGEADSAWL